MHIFIMIDRSILIFVDFIGIDIFMYLFINGRYSDSTGYKFLTPIKRNVVKIYLLSFIMSSKEELVKLPFG